MRRAVGIRSAAQNLWERGNFKGRREKYTSSNYAGYGGGERGGGGINQFDRMRRRKEDFSI